MPAIPLANDAVGCLACRPPQVVQPPSGADSLEVLEANSVTLRN